MSYIDENSEDTINNMDKIDFILENKKYLNRNDLITIRDIILENDKNLLIETLNGLKINLCLLSNNTINILYNFVNINSRL